MENKLALAALVSLFVIVVPGFETALTNAFNLTVAPAWVTAGVLTFFVSSFGPKVYSAFKK